MQPEIANHLPWVLGAGAVTVSGIVAVLKGYKWLVSEIRGVITDAMQAHEGKESEWQKAIESRLSTIESKVDTLIAGAIVQAAHDEERRR